MRRLRGAGMTLNLPWMLAGDQVLKGNENLFSFGP
jgi:hypothetical protein